MDLGPMGGANYPGLACDRVPAVHDAQGQASTETLQDLTVGNRGAQVPLAVERYEDGYADCPECGRGMRRTDMTQEDDELVMHLECSECGHNRKRPLSRGDGLGLTVSRFVAKGRTPLPRPHVWFYPPVGYHR